MSSQKALGQSQSLVDALDRAMTAAMARLDQDMNLALGGESGSQGFIYHQAASAQRAWRNSGKCVYPGCTNASIRKSHTVQKSRALELVAEGGHVLSPEIDMGVAEMRRVGVSEASTFPGFCKKHEAMFSRFEKSGTLTDDTDMRLQVLRTICRDVVLREHMLRSVKRCHRAYLAKRDLVFAGLVQGELADLLARSGLAVVNATFRRTDHREIWLLDYIRSASGTLRRIRRDLFWPCLRDLKRNSCRELTLVGCRLNRLIPVCIAGLGEFGTQDGPHAIHAATTVLPHAGGTLILLAFAARHHQSMESYWHESMSSPLRILSLVEYWMIRQTCHWFIRPSTWQALPKSAKSAILDDFARVPSDPETECSCSVFDELRKEMLVHARALSADPYAVELRALIQRETAKLAGDTTTSTV